jgi:hypothetical protein
MREAIVLLGFLVGAFLLSVAVAYVATGRKPKPKATPKLGATLRLRGAGGIYRAKLLGFDEDRWRISCPLSRNNYVPLRIEDRLTIEAPVEEGVIVYRTQICGRDDENHEFLVDAPDDAKVTDRRQEKRRPLDLEVRVEGHEGRIVNLSSLGARILTNRASSIGERIRLELADGLVYGWVLDFWPARAGEDYRESVRVRFEEVFSLPN